MQICLSDLSEAAAKAYMLADSKLTDRSNWDDELLAVHLKELSDLGLTLEIEATGFETAEIDLRILPLDTPEEMDDLDSFALEDGPVISRPGDLWTLGPHRVYCGNALDGDAHRALMQGDKAAAVFTDLTCETPARAHKASTAGEPSR